MVLLTISIAETVGDEGEVSPVLHLLQAQLRAGSRDLPGLLSVSAGLRVAVVQLSPQQVTVVMKKCEVKVPEVRDVFVVRENLLGTVEVDYMDPAGLTIVAETV